MTTEEALDSIDIDALVGDLERRVAARRADGDYPLGLEQQLEAEFKIIMAAVHRDEVNTTELGRRVKGVESAIAGIRSVGVTESRVPGGSSLHGAAARLVNRHTSMLAESIRWLGNDVASALHEIHHLFDLQRDADERQLTEVVASVMDRLAVLDHIADAVVLLEQRIAALEPADQLPS